MVVLICNFDYKRIRSEVYVCAVRKMVSISCSRLTEHQIDAKPVVKSHHQSSWTSKTMLAYEVVSALRLNHYNTTSITRFEFDFDLWAAYKWGPSSSHRIIQGGEE